MKLVDFPRTGPRPNYCDADVYWTLWTLKDMGRMGRSELSVKLGMGEGSTRSVIKKLREANLVSLYQTGTRINECGLAFLKALPLTPVDVDVRDIVQDEYYQAVVVKGVADKVMIGAEQRDVAIRAGGTGCITIVYSKEGLMIPPDWNLDERSKVTAVRIRALHIMEENDVLVIGSAKNPHEARNAAVTVALELL